MSKFIKIITQVVIITMLTMVGLELMLRVMDPIGIWYFEETQKYFASMRSNDDYAYIHKPGLKGNFQGVDVVINSYGLRGPEFDEAKKKNKKRILIHGDSVVFGWGAPQKEIFSQKLQRNFDMCSALVEIIPAGVGSWNTRTEYEYFRSEAIKFKPDIVVILITTNDLEPKLDGRTEVSKEQLLLEYNRMKIETRVSGKTWTWLVNKFHFFKYIQYFFKRNKIMRSRIKVEENSPRWKDAKMALNSMIKLCYKKNIDFVVFLYTSNSAVKTNTVLNQYNKHLKKIGIAPFFLPEILFNSSALKVSFVDGHPNTAGHRIIAREMFKVLYQRITKKNKRSLKNSIQRMDCDRMVK